MYEDQTFEVIMTRLLSYGTAPIDKREGSVSYDSLAAAGVELAKLYIEIDWLLEQSNASTAARKQLILHCKDRGIEPTPATKAVLQGEFNLEVSIGSRFSLEDLHYTVISKISDGVYQLECETTGKKGNEYLGDLIPVSHIRGLTMAKLTALLIPGEEEEETEHLRKRYFSSLQTKAYGGNVADYKEKVNTLAGVGGVKVYPAWNGGGTVKLVIINSDYGIPSEALVQSVQTAIDPTSNSGQGYGIAPIGHTVTVVPVKEIKLDIVMQLAYQAGYNFEICKADIENAIDTYLKSLNKTWEDTDTIVVRISRIESLLLDIEGIIDVYDTTINSVSGNYVAESDYIVTRGDISET